MVRRSQKLFCSFVMLAPFLRPNWKRRRECVCTAPRVSAREGRSPQLPASEFVNRAALERDGMLHRLILAVPVLLPFASGLCVLTFHQRCRGLHRVGKIEV